MLLSVVTIAQEQSPKADTIVPKKERYGIRLGADLFKLTRSFYDKNYKNRVLFAKRNSHK